MASRNIIRIPDYFAALNAASEWYERLVEYNLRERRKPTPRPEWGAFDPAGGAMHPPGKPEVPSWEIEEPAPISAVRVAEEREARWGFLADQRPSARLADKYRNEWDFRMLIEECGEDAFQGQQILRDCLFYELARESASLRAYVTDFRQAKEHAVALQKRLGLQGDCPSSTALEKFDSANRDWNIAFFLLLRTVRHYDLHPLLVKSDFPHRPWLDYSRSERPRRENSLLKRGGVQISREEKPYVELHRQLLPVPSGLFDHHISLTATIDLSVGRKKIEEAWKEELTKRLNELDAVKKAGSFTAEDGLNALSALRLLRLMPNPWVSFGSQIRKSNGDVAPLGTTKLWKRAARRSQQHFHHMLLLPVEENPLTQLDLEISGDF